MAAAGSNTRLAAERNRLALERTLMAWTRTSTSLIAFGFTIYQFFQKLKDAGTIQHDNAPRRFGTALVVLGVALLIGGIGYHVAYMRDLRRTREQMRVEGLVHAETTFPVSLSLIVAVLLLLLGVLAGISMSLGVGPLD